MPIGRLVREWYNSSVMATETASRNNSVMFYVGGVLVVGLIIGGAIMLGRADEGQINVSAAISTSNAERQAEAAREGGGAAAIVAPPVSNMPNGGLVGKGDTAAKAPVTTEAEPAVEGESTTTEDGTTPTEGTEATPETN